MAKIIRQTTVIRDGSHNGFTDLQYWRHQYWVSYRKASSHASTDSEAAISISPDRKNFREVVRYKLPGYGDNRDPKLFPLSEDTLAMTIPFWVGGYEHRKIEQYILFSQNGFQWGEPIKILNPGDWLWRIREHEGLYYGLVERITPFPEKGRKHRHNLFIATSKDLIHWEEHCQVGDPALELSESDIHFNSDGTAWIVARTRERNQSYFCYSKAPYKEWKTSALNTLIHAPIFLKHEGRLFVSGRNKLLLENGNVSPFQPSVYGLAIWELTFGKVNPILMIPSAMDCSYPGLIKDPDGRICISYYSQLAYFSGIIDHENVFEEHTINSALPNDVFFAELEL